MKKIISLLLTCILVMSIATMGMIACSAQDVVATPKGDINITAATTTGLYAHAYSGSDSEAWVKWYEKDGTNYFFMPTATNADSVEIYNSYTTDATVNGTTIKSGETATVNYVENAEHNATIDNKSYKFVIMRSSAEAAVFINNPSSFDGKNLWDYLTEDKSNDASATSAVLDDKGNIDNTSIKKIKGRGNTSWDADKKGFNITYTDAIKVGSMQKCKKFSIISNFQDASLTRNRLLYDLADEIGVPYSSDSRFAEIYVNGEYIGNYQVCEKVDVGKNTLMPDIDDEDYLNYCDGSQTDFEFVCEIDAGPDEDDFTVKAGNGNNLTMKAPELEKGDPNYAKTQRYIKAKYDVMYRKVTQNASDVNDYIDIESLAQVYLINELGKNWDAGAGSFFFVYKPDSSGKYKFYASPVWDYDNSLGNARGVEGDLKNLGIKDYEEPTGWFAKHKNGYRGPNFLKESIAKCDALNKTIPTVWFEQFVPAIETKLKGEGLNDTELYSADVYLSYLTKSAAMNYIRWDIIQEPQWVADHDSIKECNITYTYNKYNQITGVDYKQNTVATQYTAHEFLDEYKYMIDWTYSRVAWMSNQYFSSYVPEAASELKGDADNNGDVNIMDATAIQQHLAELKALSNIGLYQAETDSDAMLTVMDATQIQRLLAEIIETL